MSGICICTVMLHRKGETALCFPVCMYVHFASRKLPAGLSIRGATGCRHGFTEDKFVNEAPSIYGAGGVVKSKRNLT